MLHYVLFLTVAKTLNLLVAIGSIFHILGAFQTLASVNSGIQLHGT